MAAAVAASGEYGPKQSVNSDGIAAKEEEDDEENDQRREIGILILHLYYFTHSCK